MKPSFLSLLLLPTLTLLLFAGCAFRDYKSITSLSPDTKIGTISAKDLVVVVEKDCSMGMNMNGVKLLKGVYKPTFEDDEGVYFTGEKIVSKYFSKISLCEGGVFVRKNSSVKSGLVEKGDVEFFVTRPPLNELVVTEFTAELKYTIDHKNKHEPQK